MSLLIYSPGMGSLEVICGPMFSGKTEELIRRVRRVQLAKQRVQVFKPMIDDRYDKNDVVSHSSQKVHAKAVKDSMDILNYLDDQTRIVGIDEVQFFDPGIIELVRILTYRGLRVICAGLDLDYRGRPFGPLPHLLALACEVTKIQAICTLCGQMATKTQRLVDDSEQVKIGANESYEARCLAHFQAFGIESKENVLSQESSSGA